MSTKGTVDSVTKSKTGKSWRVKIGSEFYGANFDSKIDTMLGKSVNFEWEDGKFGKWLGSWGPDTTAPAVAEAMVAGRIQAVPMGKPSVERWWLPFVSNQCAHAIAAGHIKGVADLRSWAIAAKDAIHKADGNDLPY